MEEDILRADQNPTERQPSPQEQQVPVQDDIVTPPEGQAPAEEQPLLAGKFKDVADLEKSYTELQAKLGDQGSRLGKAEEERSALLRQLDVMQTKNQEAPIDKGKADDLEQQINNIAQQVEDGDLSIGDGMKQTALISAQIAQNETVKGIHEEQSKATVAQSKKAFSDAHPDFFELQKSGVLEPIKNQLPGFHDDISAYYALKADTLQTEMAAAVESAKQEGIALGKAEMAKIAGGDANTQKVLQGGGKSAEKIGRKAGPMKRNELVESGLAALRRARGE